MIPLIIYSRRRPMQLDLLLRSIKKNAYNIYNPYIIVKIDKEYQKGYDKVSKNHPTFHYLYENDKDSFQDLTMKVISSSNDHISWSTDDNVIYRPVEKEVLEKFLPIQENQVTSLRLGYNTIVQDPHRQTVQPPLNIVAEHEDYLEWPIICYHPHENYGYPFSLDCHIFKTSLISKLLEDISFKNSSELESKLTAFRSEIDYMYSFKQSCVVNLPVNCAGGVTTTGQYYPSTLENLNQKWLDGYKIDLDDIMKYNFIGCHQEIKLSYIQEN